jgi:hypothetical protein
MSFAYVRVGRRYVEQYRLRFVPVGDRLIRALVLPARPLVSPEKRGADALTPREP